jgi:hypothetical protein
MPLTITDSELRHKGVSVLLDSLGDVEAERFITLLLREPFDYTIWRQPLFEDRELGEISAAAAALRASNQS